MLTCQSSLVTEHTPQNPTQTTKRYGQEPFHVQAGPVPAQYVAPIPWSVARQGPATHALRRTKNPLLSRKKSPPSDLFVFRSLPYVVRTMTLPAAYTSEIQDLNRQVLRSKPRDILQFCCDHFASRLASERKKNLSEDAPNKRLKVDPSRPSAMSSSFTSPFGAHTNPFGSNEGSMMQRVMEEEEENDTVTSPTTGSFNFNSGSVFSGPFGGDGSSDPPSSLRSPPNPENFPAQYNFGRRTSVSAESLKPVADNNDNWQPPVYPKSDEQQTRLTNSIAKNFLFSHMDDEQKAQVLGAMQEKPIPAKDIKVCPRHRVADLRSSRP